MDENLSKPAIEALGKTDATQCLVVGNTVFDPLTFAPEVVRFSRKQYVFLNAYRLGVPVEEAAAKAKMTLGMIERFLEQPQTIAWLKDRALKEHVKQEW